MLQFLVIFNYYDTFQVSTTYTVELLEDRQEESVRELAALLGLRKVGLLLPSTLW